MVYKTKGTCSSEIHFDIKDGKIHNVEFIGGCNGNLKALSALVEGMEAKEAIMKLKGITCGFKDTSCSDQLARGLEEAINSSLPSVD